MRFRGYTSDGKACWLCEGCNRIHILLYKTGRTRHLCYACERVARAKIKLNVEHEADRVCLMCNKKFKSTDKGNRRCARCEYRLQHDPIGKHSNKNVMKFVAAGKMFEVLPFLE